MSAIAPRRSGLVSQGTYLLTVVPSHGLWVDANFKEDQLAQHAARADSDDGRRLDAGQSHSRPCREPRARDRAPCSA